LVLVVLDAIEVQVVGEPQVGFGQARDAVRTPPS
jgi:hypothetical protein